MAVQRHLAGASQEDKGSPTLYNNLKLLINNDMLTQDSPERHYVFAGIE